MSNCEESFLYNLLYLNFHEKSLKYSWIVFCKKFAGHPDIVQLTPRYILLYILVKSTYESYESIYLRMKNCT